MNLPNFKQDLLRTRVLVLRPWFLGTLLVIFLLIPTQAYARTTTYIGNYEVTIEDNGLKKETVLVAGTMGKVVKSRQSGKSWEYTYYTTDQQGSTRQEISESVITNTPVTPIRQPAEKQSNIPKPNTYYAYGTPIPVTTSETSLRGTPKQSVLNAQTQKIEDTYTGQKKDEETNLMYYNARYYNPQTGLFIQADSVDDTPNKYQYVGGNPINNVDPSGNMMSAGDDGGGDSSPVSPVNEEVQLAGATSLTASTGTQISLDDIQKVKQMLIGNFNPSHQELVTIATALKYFPEDIRYKRKIGKSIALDKDELMGLKANNHKFEENGILGRIYDYKTIYLVYAGKKGTFGFDLLNKDEQIGVLVHEFIHTMHLSDSKLFDDFINLAMAYGIYQCNCGTPEDSFGGLYVPIYISDTNVMRNSSARTTNFMELFAYLGQSYINQGKDSTTGFVTGAMIKSVVPDIFDFLRDRVFSGQVYLPYGQIDQNPVQPDIIQDRG